MSDFDDVLERLLTDQSFAAALAADPGATLSGYRLDPDEIELLRGQVSADAGRAASAVEGRTTKSSTFGLFSSLGDLSAFGSAAGAAAHHVAEVAAPTGGGGGGVLGDAPGHDLDDLPGKAGLGNAPRHGLGDAVPLAHVEPLQQAAAPMQGASAPVEEVSARVHEFKGVGDYHNRVDADGDGHWDKATYAAREDGGVDIMVDADHDGKTDFIGRDFDRDWKVDEATIDRDSDGVFEKTMYDDNNDGWLDRTVWHKD
jgi:hypothetical protein